MLNPVAMVTSVVVASLVVGCQSNPTDSRTDTPCQPLAAIEKTFDLGWPSSPQTPLVRIEVSQNISDPVASTCGIGRGAMSVAVIGKSYPAVSCCIYRTPRLLVLGRLPSVCHAFTVPIRCGSRCLSTAICRLVHSRLRYVRYSELSRFLVSS